MGDGRGLASGFLAAGWAAGASVPRRIGKVAARSCFRPKERVLATFARFGPLELWTHLHVPFYQPGPHVGPPFRAIRCPAPPPSRAARPPVLPREPEISDSTRIWVPLPEIHPLNHRDPLNRRVLFVAPGLPAPRTRGITLRPPVPAPLRLPAGPPNRHVLVPHRWPPPHVAPQQPPSTAADLLPQMFI